MCEFRRRKWAIERSKRIIAEDHWRKERINQETHARKVSHSFKARLTHGTTKYIHTEIKARNYRIYQTQNITHSGKTLKPGFKCIFIHPD
jgi:hypothetical protein